MTTPNTPPKTRSALFERLGVRVGALGVMLFDQARTLTFGDIAQLAARPGQGLCLLCGKEAPVSEGAALGEVCLERFKALKGSVVAQASRSFSEMTPSDVLRLVEEASALGEASPPYPPPPGPRPPGRPKSPFRRKV